MTRSSHTTGAAGSAAGADGVASAAGGLAGVGDAAAGGGFAGAGVEEYRFSSAGVLASTVSGVVDYDRRLPVRVGRTRFFYDQAGRYPDGDEAVG